MIKISVHGYIFNEHRIKQRYQKYNFFLFFFSTYGLYKWNLIDRFFYCFFIDHMVELIIKQRGRIMNTISWKIPPKRKGIAGIIDNFVGPGATWAELWIQFGCAVIAGLGAALYAGAMQPKWGILHLFVVGGFAFDLMGGVITNATSSAKRWYHRQGIGHKTHLGFAGLHLLHIALFAWLFLDGSFAFFYQAGSLLIIFILLVQFSPMYLQRPIAFSCYALSLIFFIYGTTPVVGIEWFLPIFYLKVVVSHAVKEEPYRPNWENQYQ